MRKEKIKLIDSIIDNINKKINDDTWTMEEYESGKKVEIQSQWSRPGVLKHVREEYVRSGWHVTRHVELSSNMSGPFHYLRFVNPLYLRSPKEIRETGVRTKRKKITF